MELSCGIITIPNLDNDKVSDQGARLSIYQTQPKLQQILGRQCCLGYISLPNWAESVSGQMVLEKVKWAYSGEYLAEKNLFELLSRWLLCSFHNSYFSILGGSNYTNYVATMIYVFTNSFRSGWADFYHAKILPKLDWLAPYLT